MSSRAMFWVASSGDDAKWRIDIVGELDLAGAPLLDDELARALAWGPAEVVIDVSALTFCDLGGVYALRRAMASGAVLSGRLHDPVLRLLEVLGLLDMVPYGPRSFGPPARSRRRSSPPRTAGRVRA